MPPVVMVLVTVLSFALVKTRLVGIELDRVENGNRVAALFQYLEREVVLVEVLVHFRFHLSSNSSICFQEQGVPTTSMIHIDILLGQ